LSAAAGQEEQLAKLRIVGELLVFLKEQKKWWLLPIVIVIILLGILVVFSQGSPLAPFIYTLF
jgi:hypothetical protein